MKRPVISALLIIFAVVAAGCSQQFDEARRLKPSGSEFDTALYAGYMKLARAELDELDLVDTRAFAGRAAAAGRGETVVPEAIAARALPADKRAELAEARRVLLAALDGAARSRRPRDAAAAQLAFECWMQEQEENFQPADIAACRRQFEIALARIKPAPRTAAARPSAPARPSAAMPLPVPAAAPAPAPAETRAGYVVLFELDSAAISEAAGRILDKAVTKAKSLGPASIDIAGHADRSGRSAHNVGLSRRRAEAVAAAFTEAGISGSVIRIDGFGESRPAVATPDGMREPRNRRVEIGIAGDPARTAARR